VKSKCVSSDGALGRKNEITDRPNRGKTLHLWCSGFHLSFVPGGEDEEAEVTDGMFVQVTIKLLRFARLHVWLGVCGCVGCVWYVCVRGRACVGVIGAGHHECIWRCTSTCSAYGCVALLMKTPWPKLTR